MSRTGSEAAAALSARDDADATARSKVQEELARWRARAEAAEADKTKVAQDAVIPVPAPQRAHLQRGEGIWQDTIRFLETEQVLIAECRFECAGDQRPSIAIMCRRFL